VHEYVRVYYICLSLYVHDCVCVCLNISVCMCLCVLACLYMFFNVCMRVSTFVFPCVSMCASLRVSARVCSCRCVSVYLSLCSISVCLSIYYVISLSLCLFLCVCGCVCVCVCVNVRVRVYLYVFFTVCHIFSYLRVRIQPGDPHNTVMAHFSGDQTSRNLYAVIIACIPFSSDLLFSVAQSLFLVCFLRFPLRVRRLCPYQL